MNSLTNNFFSESTNIINILKSLESISVNEKIGFDDGKFHCAVRSYAESALGDSTIPLFAGFDYFENTILKFKADLPKNLSIEETKILLENIETIKKLSKAIFNFEPTNYSKSDKIAVQEKIKALSITFFDSMNDILAPKDDSNPQTESTSSQEGSLDDLGLDEKGSNTIAFSIQKTLKSLADSIGSNKIKFDKSKEIFYSGCLNNNVYYFSGASADSLIEGIDHLAIQLTWLHSQRNQMLTDAGAELLRTQILQIERLIPSLYDINFVAYSKEDQQKIEEKIDFLIDHVFLKTRSEILNNTQLPPVDMPPELPIEIKITTNPLEMRKFREKQCERLAEFRNKMLEITPDLRPFFENKIF